MLTREIFIAAGVTFDDGGGGGGGDDWVDVNRAVTLAAIELIGGDATRLLLFDDAVAFRAIIRGEFVV